MSQRESLLDAAIVCVSERGYGRTTSRDIVAQAGISSLASIVYHFGSKEALLNEAIAETIRRWIARLEPHVTLAPGRHGIDGVGGPPDEYYDTLETDRAALVGYIEALGHAQRSPQIRDQLAAHFEEFRSSLATLLGADAGEADPERGHAEASVLMALVDGLLIQWLLDPTRALTAAELRRAVTALMSGFADERGGRPAPR